MKTATAKTPRRQQSLKRVGQNLFRSDVSGRYYGIFKSGRKQIRRSLKTTDPKLAQRRVDDLRGQVGRLSTEDGRKLTFAEYDQKGTLIGGLAHRWIGTLGVEPTTRDRYSGNIEQLARTFGRSSVRGITARHVEEWAKRRKCAAPQVTRLSQKTIDRGSSRSLAAKAELLVVWAADRTCLGDRLNLGQFGLRIEV